MFQVGDPVQFNGGSVTFEPGARTAWHAHPLDQTLIITAGLGWVQTEGGPIEEVRPGDVVWFPPGEKHWHGATPTTAMTHIAVQETGWRGSATRSTGANRQSVATVENGKINHEQQHHREIIVITLDCLSDERGQGARLRLVSDRVRSFEWESLPRRQRSARDRLGPLRPCKPIGQARPRA